MLENSVKFAAVIVMLTIGSHAAKAVRVNPSPFSTPSTLNAGKAATACERDYLQCVRFIKPLCRRLLMRGMGGGSMRNCDRRKYKRCESKQRKCEKKKRKIF